MPETTPEIPPKEDLDEEIKVRVPRRLKEEYLRLARARGLDLSDVVREVLRLGIPNCRGESSR